MRITKICICSVQCLLLLLILIPLAFALGQERALPDPATRAMAQEASPAPGPTIEDVWLQNGGARLNYSALYGARQQYMGGASRIDPACSPLLPPMRAWGTPTPKKKVPARRKVAAANPCPEVKATASAPAKAAATASKASTEPTGTKASTVKKADTSKAAAAAKAAQSKVAVTDKTNGAGTAKPLNTTPKPDLPAGPKP